jgi:hemolysin III
MFPKYSLKERRIDGVLHVVGVAASLAAAAVLLHLALATGQPIRIAGAAVYGVGLVAMFGFSAAYNLAAQPSRKERLRAADHAAIFLMIAGTYTPFATIAVGGTAGKALLAAVWSVALAGMALKLLRPRRFERLAVVAYLALGWLGLLVLDRLIATLSAGSLALLGAGGVLYSGGVAIHYWVRLPHHNAIWHGLVLAAAGCHYVAVLGVVVVP